MEKKKHFVLDKDNISEEIYENIYEDYFEKEIEMKPGGEDNETEPK